MAQIWKVDRNGYVISTSGAKCARLVGGDLYLYDKRMKLELLFSLEDLERLTKELAELTPGDLTNENR